MRKIYENPNFTQVGYYQSLLEEAGIPTYLKNLGTPAGIGEILEGFPELWVVNDEDYDRALDVLEPYYGSETKGPELPSWTCPSCGVEVEGLFGECWKCGNERPGLGAPAT